MTTDSQTNSILEGALDNAGSERYDSNAEAVDLRELAEQNGMCAACGCAACGACGGGCGCE